MLNLPKKHGWKSPWQKISATKITDEVQSKVFSDDWPVAIQPHLICQTEEDKIERSQGVISLLGGSILNKKFLDFGCGEGHVVWEAQNHHPKISIGYDIKQSGPFAWEQSNPTLTTDFALVKKNAPYDYILFYDVLDHAGDSQKTLLKMAKPLLSLNGRIIVRCHPWVSRHGGHLYSKVNKAFVHMILNETELKNVLGDFEPEPVTKLVNPLKTYQKWFADADLQVIDEDVERSEVEKFFFESLISDRISEILGNVNWQVLRPLEVKNKNPQTNLTILDDASIVANGQTKRDVYSISGIIPPKPTAIRLETLPDKQFPKNGCGRAGDGNFKISHIRATVSRLDSPDDLIELRFSKIRSDYDQPNFVCANILNPNPDNAWGVAPNMGKYHFLLLGIDNDIPWNEKLLLKFHIHQEWSEDHTLGKFRISASNHELAFQGVHDDMSIDFADYMLTAK